MKSRISFENQTGYKLKIEYDGEIYNLECTQRVLIPLNPYESKQFRVSIDEEYYFNKTMFTSLLVHGRCGKYRTNLLCYVAKFDLLFWDKDIITRKVEIKQHIRRFDYDVVFPLLTLDEKIPVEYSFSDEKDKRKFKIFNTLYQLPFQFFELMLVIGFLGAAFFTEFEPVNIFLGLVGIGFLAFFISGIKKRYKLNRFDKYFEDILLFDSVPCLPLKVRKRTIVFDDEE